MNAKHAKPLNSMIQTEAQDLKILPAFAENVETATDESTNDCNGHKCNLEATDDDAAFIDDDDDANLKFQLLQNNEGDGGPRE